MTFSKRYKNNVNVDVKKHEKLQGQKDFDFSARQRNNDNQDEDFGHAHGPRFKRPSAQASRLTVTKNQPKQRSFNIPWRFYLTVIVLFAIVAGLVTTWIHRDQWLFPIKRIELQGHFDRVQPAAIEAIVGHYGKGSLLLLHGSDLQQQLQSLPWMDQVNIKRQWPNTLIINMQQKNVVARFGSNQLLQDNGTLFVPPQMTNVDNLPYINGPDNRASQLWQAYLALNDLLKPIQLTIARLEVSPRLAYTLTLSNGVVLFLGADNVLNRLNIFVKVYSKTLASRADLVQYADMRYDSGMAVGWKPQLPQPAAKKAIQH